MHNVKKWVILSFFVSLWPRIFLVSSRLSLVWAPVMNTMTRAKQKHASKIINHTKRLASYTYK